MLNSNKPHCHPRIPKPNLKILLICWNFCGKQLSQATSCCNLGRQIACFYRIKYQRQPFTGAYSSLHKNAYLSMSIFFNKVAALQPKKRLDRYLFRWEHFFLRNTFEWWLRRLKTIFFISSTSSAKSYFRPWLCSDYL